MKSSNLLFLSQLKTFIGEDVSYTNQDDNLLLAIQTTTSLFESITNRFFTKQVFEEYYNSLDNFSIGRLLNTNPFLEPTGEGYEQAKWYEIRLKQWPVDATAPITISYDPNGRYLTNLTPEQFIVDYDNGVIIIKIPTIKAKRAFKINYTAGWSDSVDLGVTENILDPAQERSLGRNIPYDLKHAALVQAAQYSAYIQASLCNDKNNNTVYLAGKSFLETYQINPTASLLLSKYKRKQIRIF